MLEMKSYLNVLNRICEEVHRNMASKPKDTDSIDWDVNVEILLFYSMIGHKPVGVNRNFMMLFIHHKFSSYLNRQIGSKVIWDHLDSMYDMAALHESEIIPFPNDEVEFELPEEYDDLIAAKFGTRPQRTVDENEQPKSSSSMKLSKKMSTSKLKQTSSTPVAPTKSTFATPIVVNKTGKNNTVYKNEPKSPTVENNAKLKSETPLVTKSGKIKRSSSPFSSKNVKTDPIPIIKEDLDVSSTKKGKSERSSSPASTKKITKVETSNSSTHSSKKSTNQEHSNSTVKVKSENSDSTIKKNKSEKEVIVSKKGKVPTENNLKKNSKSDNSNKKKNDAENSSKKSDSVGSNKQKTDGKNSSVTSKGQKIEDIESSNVPASRKSSPVVKVDASENLKKRKRQKLEESTKKITPLAKRRRT